MRHPFSGGLGLGLLLVVGPLACGGRPLDIGGIGGGGGGGDNPTDRVAEPDDGEESGERDGESNDNDNDDDEGDRRRHDEGDARLKGTDRWASSGFEDPFEALITFKDGEISGRVCGPSLWEVKSLLDGSNCGTITAGWTKGTEIIHFEFTLRWERLGTPVTYQLVGSFDGGDRITAVLRDQGSITFTRCPADRGDCPH